MPQGVIYAMFDHNKHIVPSIPANERKLEMFFAGDGGLTDATSIGCYMVTVQERAGQDFFKLYRVAGWYYSGADTGTVKAESLQARELAGSFFPGCRQKTGMQESCIKIDPACKALRAELDMLGLYTDKADNNGKDIKGNRKGIEVGIEYAQSSLADGRFFCRGKQSVWARGLFAGDRHVLCGRARAPGGHVQPCHGRVPLCAQLFL